MPKWRRITPLGEEDSPPLGPLMLGTDWEREEAWS